MVIRADRFGRAHDRVLPLRWGFGRTIDFKPRPGPCIVGHSFLECGLVANAIALIDALAPDRL
jgi:hypothetical protein